MKVALIVILMVTLLVISSVGLTQQRADDAKPAAILVHWVIVSAAQTDQGTKIAAAGSNGQHRSRIFNRSEKDKLKFYFNVEDILDLLGCGFDAPDFLSIVDIISRTTPGDDIKANLIAEALYRGKDTSEPGEFGLCPGDFTSDHHLRPELMAKITCRYSVISRAQAYVKETAISDKLPPTPVNCAFAKLVLITKTVGYDSTTEKRLPFLLRADNAPTIQFNAPKPTPASSLAPPPSGVFLNLFSSKVLTTPSVTIEKFYMTLKFRTAY